MPAVAYIFGVVLRFDGDKRSAIFTDYAALKDAGFLAEGDEIVDASTINNKLNSGLKNLSKSMFFNAIDHKGFLKLLIWIAAGSAVVHLVHLVLMLF